MTRAERKKKRQDVINRFCTRFTDLLDAFESYDIAVNKLTREVEKLIENNPQDKEFYQQCYSAAEMPILKIAEKFLLEKRELQRLIY
jgi:hypothetical protein